MLKGIMVWLRAMRVSQWTKNAAVLLAWFFAVADSSQPQARGWIPFLLAFGMAASFCLVCSSFYLLNDVSDCAADKKHPVKRLRPVAAGQISQIDAVRGALVLFAFGVSFPSALVMFYPDRTLAFGTILVYIVMQCFYSGALKHVPYVDVVVIATGFVVRAVAGAAVINARISPWLLACAFALSLFLALCKRRHEKVLVQGAAEIPATRHALRGYKLRTLDITIVLTAVFTVLMYTGYTFAPDTVSRFGTRFLPLTAVFVALGVIRYLVLVYSRDDVDRPEKILLTDRILWLVLFGYGLSAVCVLCLT